MIDWSGWIQDNPEGEGFNVEDDKKLDQCSQISRQKESKRPQQKLSPSPLMTFSMQTWRDLILTSSDLPSCLMDCLSMCLANSPSVCAGNAVLASSPICHNPSIWCNALSSGKTSTTHITEVENALIAIFSELSVASGQIVSSSEQHAFKDKSLKSILRDLSGECEISEDRVKESSLLSQRPPSEGLLAGVFQVRHPNVRNHILCKVKHDTAATFFRGKNFLQKQESSDQQSSKWWRTMTCEVEDSVLVRTQNQSFVPLDDLHSLILCWVTACMRVCSLT